MGAEGQQSTDAIADTVLAKIRAHVEGDPSQIGLSTSLADLGIHSLELTEIIFDIEEEFGIEVELNTADAWEHLSTVRDIVDAVSQLVDAKA